MDYYNYINAKKRNNRAGGVESRRKKKNNNAIKQTDNRESHFRQREGDSWIGGHRERYNGGEVKTWDKSNQALG